MQLLTGLIIDAFGELRDQLESVKENMESNCFICGINKEYFDKVPHGFDTHVQLEHNLANYMYVLHIYKCNENSAYSISCSYGVILFQVFPYAFN